MALKLTLFFNMNQQGWTETWYHPSSLDPVAFINGLQDAFYQASVAFRGPNVLLYAIRASVVGTRKNYSYPLQRYNYTGPPSGGAGDYQEDVATDAVFKIYGQLGQKRHVFFRGLRDLDVEKTLDGADNPSARLTKLVGLWIAQLAAYNLSIQYLVKPPNGGLVYYPVDIVAPFSATSPNSNLAVPVPVPLGGTSGILLFQGIPRNDLPGFPKQVAPISQTGTTPNTVMIPYRYRAQTATYSPQKLKFCILTYAYDVVSFPEFVSFSERKTGRAFGASRGRSRVAVAAH